MRKTASVRPARRRGADKPARKVGKRGPIPSDREWVGLAALARLAEINASTVRRLVESAPIRRRALPGVPVRYSRSDLLKFLESRTTRPEPVSA